MTKSKAVQDIMDRIKDPKAEMLTHEGLPVHRESNVSLLASELRALAESNPDHPAAKSYVKAAAELPDNQEVFVNTIDVESLATNKKVVLARVKDEATGKFVMMKTLGESIKEDKANKAEVRAEPQRDDQ